MSRIMAESVVLPGAGTPARREKSPVFAAGLSLLFPGLGQVSNGETLKGLFVLVLALAGLLVMLIPGVAVWLYGIYDAWATARRMNAGTVPFREAGLATIALFMIAWTAGVLVFLTLLGLAAVAAFVTTV